MRRTLVLAITLAAGYAGAHVAPSVDDNNRYLKLTPHGDRVRLAYTVFFGEVPGAQMRSGLDVDRDGNVSDREANQFGTKLAAEVAAGLDVTIDRAQSPVFWTEISVGMGSPSVRAGSFSVDMVAYLCLPSVGGRHAMQLRDRFRVVRPGETEVRIEDSPGVKIETARVGPANDASHNYRFVGPGGPLADDGVELVFEASDQAPTSGACDPGSAPPRGARVGLVVGAIVLGFVLAVIVVLVRRRRLDSRG
jgi:hypothetical protein